LKDSKDWKELYASLRRKYGLREEFTELIMLCRKCCALFWKSLGHPCFVVADDQAQATLPAYAGDKKEELIPVTPTFFLTFFSV
jgi:F-box protein 25/32